MYEDLRGDIIYPSQKEAIHLYSNHFIKPRKKLFNRWANEARKELIVEGGIRPSVREVLCVSYQELRSIHCKKE